MAAQTQITQQLPPFHSRFWTWATKPIQGKEPRVLEVGCGRGESLALLLQRQIDAYGFDLGAAEGPLLAPKKQFSFGSLSAAMTYPQQRFDLVVVRPTAAFRGELATPEHYVATANLLSCVKPAGRMMIVEPSQGRDGGAAADWMQRWERQLNAFTVTRFSGAYRDGLGWWLSLGFLKRTPRLDLRLIVLTTPDEPVSRLEWHRQARTAVLPRQKNGRRRAA